MCQYLESASYAPCWENVWNGTSVQYQATKPNNIPRIGLEKNTLQMTRIIILIYSSILLFIEAHYASGIKL